MQQKLISIVKEASNLMKTDTYQVEQKGNASNYVTSSDIAVQKYLTKHLQELLPGSQVLGEESAEIPQMCEYIWVIDPIDGTSNYIRDIGMSAISVGLLKQGEPYIGVVYQPYRDEMFFGEIGKGAFLNGKPISASKRDFQHAHLCSAMSLYDKNLAAPCFRIIERVYQQADDLRRLGSAAVELAYLAAGRVELYFEIRLFPWDVAGVLPILKEAGAVAECMYTESLPLDRPFPILAANNQENFEKLRVIVQEELPKKPY